MAWQRRADAPYVIVLDAGAMSALLIRWPWLQYLAPALAGEIIDVTTFCAAGPPFNPPVTMTDIVWFGPTPNDSRPHTLLTVTRAIARGEAFAAYCEDPTAASGLSCVSAGLRSEYVLTNNYWSDEPIAPGSTGTRVRVIDDRGAPGSVACEVFAYTISPPANLGSFGGGNNMSTGDITDYVSFPVATDMVAVHGPAGGQTLELLFCHGVDHVPYEPPAPFQDPNVDLPEPTDVTLEQLEVKLDFIQQALRAAGNLPFALDNDSTTAAGSQLDGDLGDAVGLLVVITARPAGRDTWSSEPTRYPRMAQLTLGNADGWLEHLDVEHEQSVFLPLPRGCTRWSVQCEPPMLASVTLYRPVQT